MYWRITDGEVLGVLRRSGGESCTTHIANRLGSTVWTVARHLRSLVRSGAVARLDGQPRQTPIGAVRWRLVRNVHEGKG